ncbi:hypothetical protein T484DRAFT_1884314, partial [Baffinella frigidus]
MASVPWFQQPSYTGAVGANSSIGGMSCGLTPSSALFGGVKEVQKASAEPKTFSCEPCEKDFQQQSQYDAHMATHVTCSHPGCSFTASGRVVKEHAQEEHINEAEKAERKRMFSSIETPEEIEKWKEARRRNWPSAANAARKAADQEAGAARGDAAPEKSAKEGKRGKGPNWHVDDPNRPARGRGRGGRGGRGGGRGGNARAP